MSAGRPSRPPGVDIHAFGERLAQVQHPVAGDGVSAFAHQQGEQGDHEDADQERES